MAALTLVFTANILPLITEPITRTLDIGTIIHTAITPIIIGEDIIIPITGITTGIMTADTTATGDRIGARPGDKVH
jgi:hypothetical protein